MATDDPNPGVAESDTPFAGKPTTMEARVAALEAHVTHIQGDVAEIKQDLKDLRVDARGDFASCLAPSWPPLLAWRV